MYIWVCGYTRTWTPGRSCYHSLLFLSWMRCSQGTEKEREDSPLDLGLWAVTEMEKLGPSSLGHIYREGSIQSLWRPVLGRVPRASFTGLWVIPGAALPAPGSVMAHWELRVGCGGNIYVTDKEMLFTGIWITSPAFPSQFSDIRFFFFSTYQYTVHDLLKSLLCPASVSLLQIWRWSWRMEPTAVRGEWKWSTKENGAQWMITAGGGSCGVQTAGVWSCH